MFTLTWNKDGVFRVETDTVEEATAFMKAGNGQAVTGTATTAKALDQAPPGPSNELAALMWKRRKTAIAMLRQILLHGRLRSDAIAKIIGYKDARALGRVGHLLKNLGRDIDRPFAGVVMRVIEDDRCYWYQTAALKGWVDAAEKYNDAAK